MNFWFLFFHFFQKFVRLDNWIIQCKSEAVLLMKSFSNTLICAMKRSLTLNCQIIFKMLLQSPKVTKRSEVVKSKTIPHPNYSRAWHHSSTSHSVREDRHHESVLHVLRWAPAVPSETWGTAPPTWKLPGHSCDQIVWQRMECPVVVLVVFKAGVENVYSCTCVKWNNGQTRWSECVLCEEFISSKTQNSVRGHSFLFNVSTVQNHISYKHISQLFVSLEYTAWATETGSTTVGLMYHYFRDVVTTFVKNITRDKQIGEDNPDIIVEIDKTHVSRQAKNKGGFVGKKTLEHNTISMGGVELCRVSENTYQETGKMFLLVIKDKSELTFREVIKKHVRDGSRVRTDEHPPYKWMGRHDELYQHETVIHSREQLKKPCLMAPWLQKMQSKAFLDVLKAFSASTERLQHLKKTMAPILENICGGLDFWVQGELALFENGGAKLSGRL